MKHLIVLMLLLISGRTSSFGQCAVAVCYETGKWGVGYPGRHFERTPQTDEYYKESAMNDCKSHGGTNCQVLGINKQNGTYMFISGKDKNGKVVFAIASAKKDFDEAKNAAWTMFWDLSMHVDPDKFPKYYWNVPGENGIKCIGCNY